MTTSYSPPFAFTEHGVIMAASVLNSPLAIEVSVFIVRAFVKLRETITTNKKLAQKLIQLELKLGEHDSAIRSLVVVIRKLMESPKLKKQRPIGFLANLTEGNYE